MGITGKQIRDGTVTGADIEDDTLTGADINESTLVIKEIRDADNNTKIQVEESADENIIRFDTAGTERMVILADGKVGIGTATPQKDLDIYSSSHPRMRITGASNQSPGLELSEYSTGPGTANIYFASLNNQGIANLIRDLFVGDSRFNSWTKGNVTLNSGNQEFEVIAPGNGSTYDFSNNANVNGGGGSGGGEIFFVRTNGTLGSPAKIKITVMGGFANITNGTSVNVFDVDADGGGGAETFNLTCNTGSGTDSSQWGSASSPSHTRRWAILNDNANSNTLKIQTDTDVRMSILPSGKVGIGITSPTSPLHVYGNLDGTYVATIDNDQSSNGHVLKLATDGNGSGSNLLEMESRIGNTETVMFKARADGRFGFGPGGVTSMGAGTFVVGIANSSHTADIAISQRLQHLADADTYLDFPADDQIKFVAGNMEMVRMVENGASSEITFNDAASADLDFVIKGDTNNPLFKCDAGNNRVGIGGVGSPSQALEVGGDIGINEKLIHNGDVDTYVAFPGPNQINLVANGYSFLKYDGDILINNANRDRDTKIMADNGNVVLHVDAGLNRVGIETTSPNETLTVEGIVSIKEGSAPGSNNSGYGKLYVDSSDAAIKFKNESGQTYNLLSTDGAWQEASSMVKLADANHSVIIGENSTVNTASALTVVKNRTSNMDNLTIGSCNALLWSNTDAGSTGLGFYVNSSLANTDHTPGAAIVHVDSGAFSYGTLEFKTKNGASDTGSIDTRMLINPQGQVGIGYNVNTKSSPIYDTGAADIGSLSIHSHNSTDDNGPELNFSRYDASISDGVNLGEITFWGSEDNSTYTKGARIIAQGTDAWTGSISESELLFQICPTATNSLQTGLIITGSPAGNTDAFVGIGNSNPQSKLDVYTVNGRDKYVAKFQNDGTGKGNQLDRWGVKISAGDINPSSNSDIRWMAFADGDGTDIAYAEWTTGPGDNYRIVSASDERIKIDIADTKVNASEIFKQIEMKEYKKVRKGVAGPIDPLGFIAQNLEPLIPNMVSEYESEEHDFKVKHIGTTTFIPYLVKAVQELIEKNEALEARILELETNN